MPYGLTLEALRDYQRNYPNENKLKYVTQRHNTKEKAQLSDMMIALFLFGFGSRINEDEHRKTNGFIPKWG